MAKDRDNSEKTIITEKVAVGENASSQEPYLIQISGRDTGHMYQLTGKVLTLGRDPSCGIPIDNPDVSRMHAEIDCRDRNKIILRDLGSTNGVFLNGRRLESPTELHDGDKILIGTRLYFKFCFQDAVDQNYQQSIFRAANIDALTQLYNKKYFVDVLSKEFSFARRTQQPLSLLMMDIDHFKKINDTYGHLGGDEILKQIGRYLTKNLRLENVAARYGGEEFAIILRNVDSHLALGIAERIRKNIEQEPVDFRGQAIPITVSIGIATLNEQPFATIEDFIHAADENLYTAKSKGRNQTVIKQAA